MAETGPQGEDAAAALLAIATTGCTPALAQRLMLQVTDTLGLSGAPADEADDALRAAAALQAMAAAAPRDPLEAMLAAQMAAVHEAAMRAMKRAADCAAWPEIEALYTRQATCLMELFMRQTAALEKRRARGERREAAEPRQDGISSPSATPPPFNGEGFCSCEPDPVALSSRGGEGSGVVWTQRNRPTLHKHNGRRRTMNGTGPPT